MHHLLVGLTTVALLLGAVGDVKAGIIFTDNFNNGASPLWGDERGNWTASGGVYFAQSPSNSPLTYTSLPFNLTDFSVDVDINKVQDGGIWLRGNSDVGGVLLNTGGLGGTGTGLYWQIGTSGGLVSGIYDPVSGLLTPGVSDIHLHVVVSGDTYEAFLNNSSTPATTFTTDLFASGRVALYDNSNQTFDNFVLATSVPEPATVILFGIGIAGVIASRRREQRQRGVAA